MQDTSIRNSALQTIKIQAEAIDHLLKYIDDGFEKAVDCLAACEGKIVISGIGKSAIIAQKIVATLNSTGSPAIFLHAADAIHGDLGMVQGSDVVIIISKSGESAEVKALVPLVKAYGTALIAITGNLSSYLAQQSHFIINSTVEKEACPNNLAPTTSTTAQLVMGDALAICLMEKRGFDSEDFARYHPGGALGKKLYMKVENLYTANEKPQVSTTAPVKEVIIEISKKRLGATAVLGTDGHLAGIITDGDIRRMLEKDDNISKIEARDIMTFDPVTIEPGEMAVAALELMQKKSITQLIVAEGKKYLGFIHLHDLIKEGIR